MTQNDSKFRFVDLVSTYSINKGSYLAEDGSISAYLDFRPAPILSISPLSSQRIVTNNSLCDTLSQLFWMNT
jgi:hypothetical protein